jgi:hypothetical protein
MKADSMIRAAPKARKPIITLAIVVALFFALIFMDPPY